MGDQLLLNAALIVVFVVIGGVFAATEMAIVSLRESQIQQLEASGPRDRRIARLVRDPNLFLSAVQIGVTVAGFLSSAYGASTIAPVLAPVLESWGLSPEAAAVVALVAMTLLIAYLSLVFGELVPKRLAMQRAEGFTRALAPPLRWFATAMRPVIWLLSVSTDGVLRLFGLRPGMTTAPVTADEIRALIVTAPLPKEERDILADVLEADDRRLAEVMRPRADVDFLQGDLSIDHAYTTAVDLTHSRLPVTGESVDDVLGFVHVRDLMRARVRPDESATLAQITRPILALPGTNRVLPSLATMREDGHQIALVLDEFGGTDGIVTLEDLLEELVGEIYDEYDLDLEPADATVHHDERAEVDGGLILQDLESVTGLRLPEGPYETVGGFIVDRLGRLARVGDRVEVAGWRLEVVAADERRIRRVVVVRAEE